METLDLGVSLILGGARSGKSQFAEDICHQSKRELVYLATSQVFDDEMSERIKQHQSRRGCEWQLVEEPLALCDALETHANEKTCILVDCLTLWVTNLMMADKAVDAETDRLVECLKNLPENAQVVLVSNEVGQGIVPMEKMARDFRDYAGRLHQAIAKTANRVWFITAGLPQKLK